MRLKNLYVLRDNRAGTIIGQVQHSYNEVQQARELRELVNAKDNPTPLARNPEDYELIHLGYIDEETGKIDPIHEPQAVFNCKDLVIDEPAPLALTPQQ